jgi:CubicO group peptidase (beta-lactamase class C family)
VRNALLIVCASLLLSTIGQSAADTDKALQELDAYLDQTAAQLGDSPFAAVVSKNGEVIYERYYDAEDVLGRTVKESSRWQVFSITKSFVSALVLNLCKDEILSLDDPVSKYLPAFREHGDGQFDRRTVTIRHLMSHTSGAAVSGNKRPASLPPDFDRIEIITEPGTAFEYSGLGMFVLERTLEAATGKDLEVLLNKRIIDPLGLVSTGYVYAGSATDRLLPLRKDLFHYSQIGNRAGAGLYTTARDLNRFGQFWLNTESMFPPNLKDEVWTYHGMRESDGGRYGLLWWLFESDGGFVMSGKQSKINAIIPESNTVITVIRYPQARADKEYKFSNDKRAMVLFGKRL